MPQVSIYPHIKEVKNSKTLPLSEVFEYIKSDQWKDEIAVLRQMVVDGKPDKEIEVYKNSLPYFTGSGTFSPRKDSGLIQHSGKIVIDLDKVEKVMPLSQAKELLVNDPYSEYVFLSCSGRGFGVIVNIDPSKHLESFKFLEKYYQEKYGLPVDESCKDVSRPRYISWDPDLFYNDAAQPCVIDRYQSDIDTAQQNQLPIYDTPYFIDNSEVITAPVGADFSNSITIDSDEEKYEWVKAVTLKQQPYVEGNRHNFLIIFAFFLNKAGVGYNYAYTKLLADFESQDKGAPELTRIIKAAYDKINEHGTFPINKRVEDLPPEITIPQKKIYGFAMGVNEAGRQWSEEDITSQANQYNIPHEMVRGIFRNVFKNHKDAFDLDSKPEIAKIEYFIKKRYEIYKNEITKRIEGRPQNTDKNFEIINVDEISRELLHEYYKFPLDKLKSLLRSDFVPKYNPFRNYFESLPPYESDIDYIDQLADHVQTTDQEFWRSQFKKALVRCIACSIGGKINRIIMALVGEEEETGKSSFIEFLVPNKLKDYYTEEPLTNHKDSEIQLSENFIWNLEELAALNAIEVNRLKATISKISVKQRASYAEFSERNPRRVNFWAATNKVDFLTDDQNTRWLCFEVKGINYDYNNYDTGVKNVDINNVWAQAYHLYKNNFNFRLSAEEKQKRSDKNKEFESSSLEKELITKMFKPAEYTYGYFVSNADLLLSLTDEVKGKTNINIYSIARAMKQLQFEKAVKKINGKLHRGYIVQENSVFDQQNEEVIPPKKMF